MTTQLTEMNGTQLLSHYNMLVAQATTEGLTGFRQLRVFHDKLTAIKRCEALESSLRAWREGQRAEDRREGREAESPVQQAVKAANQLTDLAFDPPGRARSPLASGQRAEDRRTAAERGGADDGARSVNERPASPVPPGLARLQAANNEEIRQLVLADQERAAQLAAAPETTPASTKRTQKVAKAKKEKTPKNGEARGRRAKYADDMKITVLVEGNPRREGTRYNETFSFYRTGMLVKTFIEKVGSRGEAFAKLAWDAKFDYIKVG